MISKKIQMGKRHFFYKIKRNNVKEDQPSEVSESGRMCCGIEFCKQNPKKIKIKKNPKKKKKQRK